MWKTTFLVAAAVGASAEVIDYQPTNTFGNLIEGASFNNGYAYAVHYRGTTDNSTNGNAAGKNVIGRVNVATMAAEAFFEGPTEAHFNGIEFSRDGLSMFLADVANKRVLKVDMGSKTHTTHCENAQFQAGLPNDLVLSKAGNLYLSGQEWNGNGGLWMCSPDGSTRELATGLNRTNGIAVSPDDNILYLTEAEGSCPKSRQVILKWALGADGLPSGAKQTFHTFEGADIQVDTDGMQCDAQGNLYATRNGGSAIMKLTPAGEATSVALVNSNPTNLVIDSSEIYITTRCNEGGAWNMGNGCMEKISFSDFPGYVSTAAPAPTAADASTVAGGDAPTDATSGAVLIAPGVLSLVAATLLL